MIASRLDYEDTAYAIRILQWAINAHLETMPTSARLILQHAQDRLNRGLQADSQALLDARRAAFAKPDGRSTLNAIDDSRTF